MSGDTIRKALGRLVAEGVIYRLRGAGTFVSPTAKVGRILVVTNFATITIPDNFGLLYGFSVFEHGLRNYESRSDLPYTLIPMDSDTYMRSAHEIHLVHKDLAGIIFFRDFNPVLATKLQLEVLGIPYIFYGDLDRCHGHMVKGNTYCYEAETAMEVALDYLVGKGHTRILCTLSSFGVRRYGIYENWMRKNGLWSKDLIPVKIDDSGLETDPLELLKHGTAVLATRDKEAVIVLNALVNAGIRVPEQVAVMGIDNYAIGLRTVVPLTSVDIPLGKDAGSCLRLFVDLLEGRRKFINERSKVSVVVRQSA